MILKVPELMLVDSLSTLFDNHDFSGHTVDIAQSGLVDSPD